MIGRAVTVEARGDLIPVLAGLQQAGSGEVLVVDAGSTSHAVLGELFASEAIRRGLAGIVVYGLCRDTATLAELPLPIYALGSTPRAHGASTFPSVSRPIRLGDVDVRPGDILVGDDDGIVVASDEELERALTVATSIQDREAAIRVAIEGGTSLFDLLNYREHVERLRTDSRPRWPSRSRSAAGDHPVREPHVPGESLGDPGRRPTPGAFIRRELLPGARPVRSSVHMSGCIG